MEEKMQETMQEMLEKLEYMENAIQILLQLTTLNSERVADTYNVVMRAGVKAGIVNKVEDDLN